MGMTSGIDWDDETVYIEIENAVADGHDSAKKIAAAIGCKYETFRARLYPKAGSSAKFVETAHKISAAIKRGKEGQKRAIKALARRGLRELICGGTTTETITEKRTVAGKETLFKRVVEKQYLPNPGAVFFALANADPENYKSIYNAGKNADDDDSKRRGMIADWMMMHAAHGSKFTEADFPGVHDNNGGGDAAD